MAMAVNPDKKKAFTLLELIVVIIIIGILATVGLSQYSRIIERVRGAEAKAILGAIRSGQSTYYLQYGSYASVISDLGLTVPTSCTSTNYFSYNIILDDPRSEGRRCTIGGKSPNWTGTFYCMVIWYDGRFQENGCDGGGPGSPEVR
ncbi:MAG: type IV pilin-like G/H family protein [Candidatus Omnitrophica bacterium]|jgi:prepilin-type N-terminal cleavage/methylation domain-containing protein|nr:type IV pilin-like G/H family protein [Candidatus Omnitrophota bacterium]